MTPRDTLQIATILGTSRPGNYTRKAIALIENELLRLNADVRIVRVDPAELILPFPEQAGTFPDVAAMQEKIRGSDGVVIATPEYHGTFPAMLKLIIENLGYPSAISNKPIGLLGVASGSIGAIKSLEMLRSVCSHSGGIVLPGPVSVANVQRVFDEQGVCQDASEEKYIRELAQRLLRYLKEQRCPDSALEQMVRTQESTS